jgi:hypothetical protein
MRWVHPNNIKNYARAPGSNSYKMCSVCNNNFTLVTIFPMHIFEGISFFINLVSLRYLYLLNFPISTYNS